MSNLSTLIDHFSLKNEGISLGVDKLSSKIVHHCLYSHWRSPFRNAWTRVEFANVSQNQRSYGQYLSVMISRPRCCHFLEKQRFFFFLAQSFASETRDATHLSLLSWAVIRFLWLKITENRKKWEKMRKMRTFNRLYKIGYGLEFWYSLSH